MTVLVTGIGGQIGRSVADHLHACGVAVRATSSRPERVAGLDYPVLTADLNRPDSLGPALDGVRSLLLYAGTGPTDRLAEVLRRSSLERIVVISSRSVEMPAMAQMSAHFVEVEDAVRSTGISWTFLRGDYFAGNTLGWASEIAATGGVSLPYPGSYLEPVHETDIADLAVLALTADDHRDGRRDHRDTAYSLTGPQSLTQAEMVGIIAEVTGRRIEVRPVEESRWKADFTRYAPEFVADALLAMWRAADGRPGRVDQTVAAAGLRPRDFRSWVQEHADAFAAAAA